MCYRNLLLICLLVGAWIDHGQAQGIHFPESDLGPDSLPAFAHRVNSLSDFIRLFNYGLAELSEASDDNIDLLRQQRAGVLELLFAPEAFRSAADTHKLARQYVHLMGDLTSPAICSVDLADTRLFARVVWEVTYQGVDTSLLMILQKERLTDGASRWYIRDVAAPYLTQLTQDPAHFIPPNSSDLMFLHLSRAQGPFQAYVWSGHQPDPLSGFILLANQRSLVLKHARSVEIHLLPTADWALVIEETDTDPPRTGWLITRFAPVAPDQPYLQSLLGPQTP